jgi:hypothetical protein
MFLRTFTLALVAMTVAGCDPPPPLPDISTYDGVYGGGPSVAHASNSIFCFHPAYQTLTVSHGIAKLRSYGANDWRIGTVAPDGQLTMEGSAFSCLHATVSGRFSEDAFVGLSSYGPGTCEYDWSLKKVGKTGSS